MTIPKLMALAALASSACAQTIEFKTLTEGVLESELRLAHPKVSERYLRLRGGFERYGCAALREQAVRGSKEPNLICPVGGNGASDRRIVVGAHYDCSAGEGVIDNWTGAILLPNLAAFLREKPRRHAFEFVGFAAEEKGLLGSRAYLKAIPKPDRKAIAAVITMDSLGLGPAKCWPNSSSKELMAIAAAIARVMKLSFAGVDVDAVGSTDSAVFHDAKIPVLSLHSVTQETYQLINSPRDVWAALQWKDYYDTYRLVSALLAYLDEKLP